MLVLGCGLCTSRGTEATVGSGEELEWVVDEAGMRCVTLSLSHRAFELEFWPRGSP